MRKYLGILGVATFFGLPIWGDEISPDFTAKANEVCSYQEVNPQGAFMNLFLSLDFSGSMRQKVYKGAYNPSKIYTGYFDPFGVYREIRDNRTGNVYYEKVSDLTHWKSPYKWAIWYHGGINQQYKYFSGNYLNWKYLQRANFEKLLLTGGKVTTLKIHSPSEGAVCGLTFNFLTPMANTTGKVFVPIPCFIGDWFIKPMVDMYHLSKGFSKKHYQRKLCHLIPNPQMRHECLKAPYMDVVYKKEYNQGTEREVQAVEFNYYHITYGWFGNPQISIRKVYIRASDTTSYNPVTGTVEGILQKLERQPYRPRVGLAIFAGRYDSKTHKDTLIQKWIYPSYDYSFVIGAINDAKADGGTPTGETLSEIERYFSLRNGTWRVGYYSEDPVEGKWEGFSVNDKNYVNPYIFPVGDYSVEVPDAKNEILLVSDGAWNGYGKLYSKQYLKSTYFKYSLQTEGIKIQKTPFSNWQWLLKCHAEATLKKNLPDISGLDKPYYRCAVDPVKPVFEMWKNGNADLVSSIPGNQKVETAVIATFVDKNSYGYNALRNIAYYGSCTGDNCPTKAPPEPVCSYEQEPPCGSFNNPQTAGGNFYDINTALDYYKYLTAYLKKVVDEATQYACKSGNIISEPPINPQLQNLLNNLLGITLQSQELGISQEAIREYLEVLLYQLKAENIVNHQDTNAINQALVQLQQGEDITTVIPQFVKGYIRETTQQVVNWTEQQLSKENKGGINTVTEIAKQLTGMVTNISQLTSSASFNTVEEEKNIIETLIAPIWVNKNLARNDKIAAIKDIIINSSEQILGSDLNDKDKKELIENGIVETILEQLNILPKGKLTSNQYQKLLDIEYQAIKAYYAADKNFDNWKEEIQNLIDTINNYSCPGKEQLNTCNVQILDVVCCPSKKYIFLKQLENSVKNNDKNKVKELVEEYLIPPSGIAETGKVLLWLEF